MVPQLEMVAVAVAANDCWSWRLADRSWSKRWKTHQRGSWKHSPNRMKTCKSHVRLAYPWLTMSNSNLVYLLLTAYQSSIHSSHIASLRGAALEVIGWPPFCHQATERSRFPTQRCAWKGKCSKVSHFTDPCRTCSRFCFFPWYNKQTVWTIASPRFSVIEFVVYFRPLGRLQDFFINSEKLNIKWTFGCFFLSWEYDIHWHLKQCSCPAGIQDWATSQSHICHGRTGKPFFTRLQQFLTRSKIYRRTVEK